MLISKDEKSEIINMIKNIQDYLHIEDYMGRRFREYENRPPLCYKLDVIMEINPYSIFEYMFGKKAKNMGNFTKDFFDKNLKKDESDRFEDTGFYKIFYELETEIRFNIYKDETSGFEQIWSNYNNGLIDDLNISDYLLEYRFMDDNDNLKRPLIFNPGHISVRPFEYEQETILDNIPFYKIVGFLKDLYLNYGDAMQYMKTFPNKLQEFFNKNNIIYSVVTDTEYGKGGNIVNSESVDRYLPFKFENEFYQQYSNWIKKFGIEFYESNILWHTFESKFYTLKIKIKFFDNFSHSHSDRIDEDYSYDI